MSCSGIQWLVKPWWRSIPFTWRIRESYFDSNVVEPGSGCAPARVACTPNKKVLRLQTVEGLRSAEKV